MFCVAEHLNNMFEFRSVNYWYTHASVDIADIMFVCIYVIIMNHSREIFIPQRHEIATTCYTSIYYVCNVIDEPLYLILLIGTFFSMTG